MDEARKMDPAKYQHVVDIDALFYTVLARVQVCMNMFSIISHVHLC